MKLGLTDKQLTERRLHIHAGDAQAIMDGNYRSVFRRIKGLDAEEDLSGEFRVQLGSYTEPFGLYWTERQTGRPIEYFSANPLMRHIWHALTGRDANPQELAVSKQYPWLAYNRDSLTTTPHGHRAVLDAKHVGAVGEAMTLRYTAAGTLQATVDGCDWWGMAPIVGNKWQEPIFQEVDPLYQSQLIARSRECWAFIERDEEPPEIEAKVLPPKPQPKLRSIAIPTDDPAVFDALCRSNNWLPDWCKEAARFAGTQAAATVNNIARSNMKDAMPEDVGTITWGLIKQHKDRAGAVRMSLGKGEE